ncbi:hypothetical protein VTK56DRAFT_7768 [Thermocarpiscus australiensis]
MDSRHRAEGVSKEPRKRPEQAADEDRDPKYHVYVRLPFSRGDFVDPGPVNWDEKKSEALWSILSDVSLTDVDWTELATQFDVTVDFLLQMANYLTERHTSQLRARMLKAAAARGSNAPSPVPGAEPSTGHQATAESRRRTSSGGGRAPSALSMRKETATPLRKNEEEYGGAGTVGASTKSTLPMRPQSSRNSSANTAVLSQNQPGPRPVTATARLSDPQRRRLSYLPTPSTQQQQQEEDTEVTPSSPAALTSSSSSSSSSESLVQSRIIRRPPRFQPKGPTAAGGGGALDSGGDGDGDDDDDPEPAFLPFKPQDPTQDTGSSGQDLGATLRGDMRDLVGRRAPLVAAADAHQSQTSDSSAGSAALVSRRPGTATGAGAGVERRVLAGQRGPLSPRRTAELAGRGPASSRGKGASREGSDGTPSMGSSFSDLDDASVTQSALEEALASRMQDGTIGSRMSVIGGTIGQAFRSRYLPRPNRQ